MSNAREVALWLAVLLIGALIMSGCGGCTVTFYNRQDNEQTGCECPAPPPAGEPAK